MRSDGIHKAFGQSPESLHVVPTSLVATRKCQDPDLQVQDVINDVLGRFANTDVAIR
jgi:hypothetical protein